MLKNYLKIALRQLWKHKLFSALNIFGLAASMSICLLLFLILSDQYGYDTFHEKGDRIYRVISGGAEKGHEIKQATWATSPLTVTENLERDYPFIEHAVRVVQVEGDFKVGENVFDDLGENYAVDSDFLEVFDFGWKAGDEYTALQKPFSMVLTEELAQKFFPNQNAVGQELEILELGNFTVTGVLPDPPIRSHIYFDYLVSYSTILSLTKEQRANQGIFGFNNISRGLTYLLLDEKNDQQQLDDALATLAVNYSEKDPRDNYYFESQTLGNIMPSNDLSNEIGVGTPAVVMYFLIALGILIMFTACFNYMNLSVARSLKRAKEIGVRKVIGARKKDIIFQFLGEAVLIATVALIVAIGLLQFLIPAFYSLHPFVEEIFYLKTTPQLYLMFFGFSLLIGLFAGVFPAFNISSFSPLQAIQQLANVKVISRIGIRKALITSQFTLSLIFILAVIIVLQQQKYVLQTDLGVKTDHILNVSMQGEIDYEVFAQRVRQLPNVESVSAISNPLSSGGIQTIDAVFKNGQDSMKLKNSIVSPDYIENMGVELLAGEAFPKTTNSKGEQFVLLNEKAIQRMGYETPEQALGEELVLFDTLALSIAGVMRDFHYSNNIWFDEIQPFALRSRGDRTWSATIAMSGAEENKTIAAIRAVWNELSPNESMSAFLVTDRIYHLSKFFQMGSKIIGFVGFLTILIACMGLLGMVIYTVEGRIKEIGIRKVLGASEKNMIWQLSKGFVWLLGIAIVIAVPLTIFGANLWLQNFVIRVSVSPSMILMGIGILLLLGILTVVSQTYLAAKTNPVESLRSE
ncbi:MAG: FtsX-like permease family protein [Bacteroidota bacterium]